jgi:hypothetical protein
MTTFNDINWKSMQSSFGRLTKGQQFQLANSTDWNGELYGKDCDEQQAIALETTRAQQIGMANCMVKIVMSSKQLLLKQLELKLSKSMKDQSIMSTIQKVLFRMPGHLSRS